MGYRGRAAMTETAKPATQRNSSNKPKAFDERSKDGKLARNFGRIQFRAVMPSITKMLEQGYDLKKIYCELFKTGKITMSYKTFLIRRNYVEQRNPGTA
jgi:hypothetical protein